MNVWCGPMTRRGRGSIANAIPSQGDCVGHRWAPTASAKNDQVKGLFVPLGEGTRSFSPGPQHGLT